ncbi:MAG: NAD(P)H-hydrate epimerase [Candidatus Omnitrophica bacterium]|nr:NAD(P)H-hydrate epimerase [Candidatus Omnitrophota bacterium]
MKYLSSHQLRVLDRRATQKFGIPAILLMENAGRAVAEEVLRFRPRPSRVLIFAGRGNNGGDGLVAARHLAVRGVSCAVIYFGPPATAGSALQFRILGKMKVPLLLWSALPARRRKALLARCEVIVDAIFGLGVSRDVEEPYRAAIEAINRSRKPVVSVDIPSGLDADTGRVMGVAVRAARTVTFVAPKLGFRKPSARAATGKVIVADISVLGCRVRLRKKV